MRFSTNSHKRRCIYWWAIKLHLFFYRNFRYLALKTARIEEELPHALQPKQHGENHIYSYAFPKIVLEWVFLMDLILGLPDVAVISMKPNATCLADILYSPSRLITDYRGFPRLNPSSVFTSYWYQKALYARNIQPFSTHGTEHLSIYWRKHVWARGDPTKFERQWDWEYTDSFGSWHLDSWSAGAVRTPSQRWARNSMILEVPWRFSLLSYAWGCFGIFTTYATSLFWDPNANSSASLCTIRFIRTSFYEVNGL